MEYIYCIFKKKTPATKHQLRSFFDKVFEDIQSLKEMIGE